MMSASRPADWCAEFIGLPFKDHGRDRTGFDCWGVVRCVLQDRFGINDLPDYCESYDNARNQQAVSSAVEAGLASGWRKLSPEESPREGDLIILKLAGRPWHCAISAGSDWMMHCVDDIGVIAEQWSNALWRNRVEGFYRHV
jgi:cell wall-associated NlpC family hydrolase